jgi:hypothetical protein
MPAVGRVEQSDELIIIIYLFMKLITVSKCSGQTLADFKVFGRESVTESCKKNCSADLLFICSKYGTLPCTIIRYSLQIVLHCYL